MSGRPDKILLDTNIIIDLFQNRLENIDYFENADIYVPVIVIGELLYGARNSNSIAEKINQIEEFCSTIKLLGIGEETATLYGEIKAELKLKGKPIPENDIWIAAITKEHDLPLMTQDKHFQYISYLKLLN